MLNAAQDVWQILTPTNLTLSALAASLEMKRCHVLENWEKDLQVVQELEMKLGVVLRWVPSCQDWKTLAAAVMAGNRRYLRRLDDLEGLIVSCMFELTKINMSQTGAKLFLCLLHQILTNILFRVQTSETYSYSLASPLPSNL